MLSVSLTAGGKNGRKEVEEEKEDKDEYLAKEFEDDGYYDEENRTSRVD